MLKKEEVIEILKTKDQLLTHLYPLPGTDIQRLAKLVVSYHIPEITKKLAYLVKYLPESVIMLTYAEQKEKQKVLATQFALFLQAFMEASAEDAVSTFLKKQNTFFSNLESLFH